MAKDRRPEISPYAVPSIAFCFQGDSTLYVPAHLLTQSHKLESMNLQNTLEFVDVSPDAGHVLVHYLFTGTYQSLKLKTSPFGEKIAAEFLTSVRVYTAAQTYILPPLVELAKGEIERLGKDLRASLVFDLVRDAHPSPGTDDIWLGNYLKAQLKLFLESSPKPLAGAIAGERNTMSISDILFKNIFELFHENTVLLHEEHKEALRQPSMNTAHLELSSGSSNEPMDVTSKREDQIQKDPALESADHPHPCGIKKEDKIKSDETRPLSEIHVEVKPAQYVGAGEEKNAFNPWSVGASKEKERKKERGKKNKKNNNKSLAVINPPPGSSEDYLLVKSEQNAKDEICMRPAEDPWGSLFSRNGKEKNTRSDIKTPVPVSSDGDLIAEHKLEARVESNSKALDDEGWNFWGLGKNAKNNKESETLDLESPLPPLLPPCPEKPGIPADYENV